MGSVIVQGLKSGLMLTCGYGGGTTLLTALDLGIGVGSGDGAKAKGSTDTTAKGGAG